MHPKALLDHCAALLAQVLRFDHPADAVVSRYFRENRQLGQRERATLAETVYAVLRRKAYFELLARSGSGPKERRLAILGFAADRGLLSGALSQQEKDWLHSCDTVQESELLPVHRHNLPQWLATELEAQLGERFMAVAESFLEPAPLDIRVNSVRAKRAEVQKALAAEGLAAQPTSYSPWGLRLQGKPGLTRLDLYQQGSIEIQDEGSQLLALLLDARRGEMVVDFCAGAGGKTLAIGATMRNTGRLYAFDVSAHRLENLKPRLARSGLSNVHPAAIAHERDDRIKRLAGKIDRVLVDAPCSGLGTLRRNPDLKWRQDPAIVEEFAVKQTAILASAARLVKPGGRLVYATCSVLPMENEVIADAFGVANLGFRPLNASELLTQLKVSDAASLCSPASGAVEAGRYLRLWPDLHGTDGFFAAAWQKL
ncbi:MAG: RsmB/NOP family class I SAM-dependent RNA methyltransferase [Brachymonas denitrificans]|uniref:RsmB/NOP family class I SAM-dependent RNA methyltransferase n=1 Tax=Brachymonas denitrificans TaxID=28220 RepID=UPI0032207B00